MRTFKRPNEEPFQVDDSTDAGKAQCADLEANNVPEVTASNSEEPSMKWKDLVEKVKLPAVNGSIIDVYLTWRGRGITLKLFFPQSRTRKPSREDRVSVNTMEQALADDVHCMVTFNSIAALESMVYGVPAIVLGPNCAQDICEKRISNIEFIKHPGRKQLTWLCRYLSNNQFVYDEMLNGFAWSRIK